MKHLETYLGFDIIQLDCGYDDFINIYQDSERFSCMRLSTIKAAKNVIDTWLRSEACVPHPESVVKVNAPVYSNNRAA